MIYVLKITLQKEQPEPNIRFSHAVHSSKRGERVRSHTQICTRYGQWTYVFVIIHRSQLECDHGVISGTAPVQNGLPPFRFDFRDFKAGLGLGTLDLQQIFFILQSIFCDQSHLPCRGLQQLQPGMRWCVQHSQLIILTVNPCHVLTNVHNITCNLKTRTSSLFTLEYQYSVDIYKQTI